MDADEETVSTDVVSSLSKIGRDKDHKEITNAYSRVVCHLFSFG